MLIDDLGIDNDTLVGKAVAPSIFFVCFGYWVSPKRNCTFVNQRKHISAVVSKDAKVFLVQ